jgi:hypothetical protein
MGSYDFEALTVIISSLGSALAGTPDAKFNSCFTGDCNPEKNHQLKKGLQLLDWSITRVCSINCVSLIRVKRLFIEDAGLCTSMAK